MSKIKQLSKELVSKIAAGEVVESPASVVKELLENAIDAGAKNIKVDIEGAGFKKISIVDDGVGMGREDLENSINLHTTSKISDIDDLWNIDSLGFRGEALASISAVSNFVIKSKTSEADIAYQLTSLATGEIEIKEIAMNRGTVVTVSDLFVNTPARLRFVKSKSNVTRKIFQVVSNVALTFPEISFSLTHNDKEVFRFLSGDTLEARVQKVLGLEIFSHLLPIEASSAYSQISGFIGRPQISTKTRSRQFLFINNRAIKNPAIALRVRETYQSLLSPRDYPVFMLFVTMPAQSIDVNVHPRKEEVKILNQKEMLDALTSAIQDTLTKNDLTYQLNSDQEETDFDGNSADIVKKTTDLWTVKEKDYSKVEVAQLHNTYLINETGKGLMITDQHAAHERILFEELKDAYQNLDKQIVELKDPVIIELPKKEADFLIEKQEEIQSIGFIIEDFGENTFKLTSVPEFFKDRDLAALIKEMLDDMATEKEPLELDYRTERTLDYLACRSAIKAGDYLTVEERRRLLEKLQETNTGYTCPHGRPSQVEISKEELEKMFKRR
ncbi:MAG: DNA mismatch repair endonuclease MutL [Candidatus Moraniibacteriota bacterium]|jgi:DNA mismatch repair protein MutL